MNWIERLGKRHGSLLSRDLCFLDTETTGLNPHRHEVLEVAFIRENADGTIRRWECKIKPQEIHLADPKALEVNGYLVSENLWSIAPTFGEVSGTIREFVEDCILIGQNTRFDVAFLQSMFDRWYTEVDMHYHLLDVSTLAYAELGALADKLSLTRMREIFEIPKDQYHSAMKDTEDVREVYQILTRQKPGLRRAKMKLLHSLVKKDIGEKLESLMR